MRRLSTPIGETLSSLRPEPIVAHTTPTVSDGLHR